MSQLRTSLYPFQRDTIDRAKGFNGRCILALEQGLGKTLCAISYIMETKSFPAVIVCPASLKLNWAEEFHKHYGKQVTILSGSDPKKFGSFIRSGDRVFIINYDILHHWVPVLQLIRPEIVVLDESHYIKNSTAKRTKAAAQLVFQADKFLALSGTPMASNPMELYTTLNMIFKGHMVSKTAFMNRYTNWYMGRYGIKIKGPKNMLELNTFLKNRCMIRYKVDDVLPDLPPYIRQTTLLEMTASQAAEYQRLQDEFDTWLLDRYPDRRVPASDFALVVTRFGYMKRAVAEWKLPAIIDSINNFLDGNEGKLIVFGLHRKILDAIWSVFAKKNKTNSDFIVRLDGSTSELQRHQAVFSFQNNPDTRLFLGQMTAAGVGLTLTASHNSLFTELDFMPVNHLQAEARNRRIGTTASFVHYNYLIMKDTIEETICDKLFQRQCAVDAVIDGKESTGHFNLVSDILRARFDRFNG